MSFSSSTSSPTSYDPLSSSTAPTTPTPSSSRPPPRQEPTPLSFKRRTTTSTSSRPSFSGTRASGLLGSILSRSVDSEEERDKVPVMLRTEAPNFIEIPKNAYDRSGREAGPSRLSIGNDLRGEEDDITPSTSPNGRDGRESRRGPLGNSGSKQREVSFARGVQVSEERERNRHVSNTRWETDGEGGDDIEDDDANGTISGAGGGFYSTPLPRLPMFVLCIALLGEFLSASVSSPFLYFMIESFGVGQGPDGGGEAVVGLWTGIVGSTFFLSQFLTSLLWVSVAEKHGRRAVLFTSLLGNAITLVAFGTSQNLGTAICIRLAMGLFNGAVGVARGAVQSITDPSNESRAFTLMGLCWGLGGIVGSIVGGVTESPVKNIPFLFRDSVLFAKYPYLLPCMIAGSVTGTGAILSLFLGPDGGAREGGIQLPTEKDVERAAGTLGATSRQLVRKVSAYFQSDASGSTAGTPDRVALHRADSAPGAMSPKEDGSRSLVDERDNGALNIRRFSTKASNMTTGSAYGYNPLSISGHSTRASGQGTSYGYDGPRFPNWRRRNTAHSRFRSASAATSTRYAPDYDDVEHKELNFAQRLLLANEGAVFSLSDLWVAEATRTDDPYDDLESVFEDGDDDQASRAEDEGEPEFFGYGTAPPSMENLRGQAAQQDAARSEEPRRSPSLAIPRTNTMDSTMSDRERAVSYGTRYHRGVSISSPRTPAIYSNTGLDPQSLASTAMISPPSQNDSAFNPMAGIPETRPSSIIEIEAPLSPGAMVLDEKKEVSLIRQLPLVIIGQYALLALHGTVCDAVFMSFLVTPIPSGGLGLSPANYAALVATMFFFSMVWQFRFYPAFSAPRGSLSHLAMFRLGLALYLPVYLLFPELRGLLHEEGNGWVMFGMTLLSAIRYLANTCAYTSIMILINAMTPPHLVPLANGLAQSAVSLARFIGPIVGGSIWALSIANGPTANPWPFNYAAGFVVISVLCFAGLLHSFRIH